MNGATTGVLLFLMLFGGLTALVARDLLFLVFAAWSLTSLRTIAINDGWALNWLFANIPSALIPTFISATLCLHCLLTFMLFRAVFFDELRSKTERLLGNVLVAGCLVLILCSPLSEYSEYQKAVWALAGTGMVYMSAGLVRTLVRSPSQVYIWYAAFWLATFAGLAAEIAFTAGLVQTASSLLNAQTGALGGALLLAIAISQRFLTERKEKLRARESELTALRQLSTTYEAVPVGLASLDPSGQLLIFNKAFSEIFADKISISPPPNNLNLRELLGETIVELIRQRSARGEEQGYVVTHSINGGIRHFQLTSKMSDAGFDLSIQDVSSKVNAEASLARIVDHDVQTKALNQRGLNEAVSRALERVSNGSHCSMLDIDIDRFKTLNDLYGHLVGDQFLSAACDRLMALAKPTDSIARIGDSFKIVLFDCDSDSALTYVTRLHREFTEKPFEVAGRLLTASASIGLVSLDPSMTVRDAIASTSQACAEAKTRGRNRVVQVGKQDLALKGYLEELQVQATLQDKLDSQRFFLLFQPIVSLRSAFESMNYEVLIRMRDEDGSVVSPGKFIPAAERNGQMSLIDKWVLLKTLQWLDEHREHASRIGYATINMSGASLNDARFVDEAFATMARFPHLTSKLCFEITETVALADRRATQRFADRVHSMGGKIALDDFGAGYTSFTYLREIHADIIKIDGSFVKDINQNPANYAITRMIVELAHELKKTCVAEWAEHPDVIATLMSLGVDYGQGFALARPMDPALLCEAESCGDLVTNPAVRALLRGDSPPEALAGFTGGVLQPALF